MPTHRWRFFRAGGFDQVRIDSGADICALPDLDYKLWVALSCPTRGVDFDAHTLELLDGDKDGHIRASDVLEAVRFTCGVLIDPELLVQGSVELPLSAIDTKTTEGERLLASAKRILANIGKADGTSISPADTIDTARVFAGTRFNGDGIIIPDSAEDDAASRATIELVVSTLGGKPDASGGIGVDQEKIDAFFSAIDARVGWILAAPGEPVLPDHGRTYAAYLAIRDKVDDFFTRVQLAEMDPNAAVALNPSEAELRANTDAALLPLARVEAGARLPLEGRVNPAWRERLLALRDDVVRPIVGDVGAIALSVETWRTIKSSIAAHEAWAATKPASAHDLAIASIDDTKARELHKPDVRQGLQALVVKDKALEAELTGLDAVDRLVHYHAHLHAFLNQFVAFRDFYSRTGPGMFQAGTLYLDGRSAELTMRVDDVAKHAVLAVHAMTYLAYCDCVRRAPGDKPAIERPTERIGIVAAFTAGDSDFLMVGRNGVFVDRKGNDWDATITRVIEQPISVRQAFFSPYKRVAKTVSESVEKLAGAKNAESHGVLGSAVAGAATTAGAPAAVPVPPAPFDVAKFAGIFAAIGLALGTIGSAIAAVVGGFMGLRMWQMPLAISAGLLLISGPSMILAQMKLRQRNLGPLLDAAGWAINARARVNVYFGRTLTGLGTLPVGARRDLRDPYGKAPRWPYYLVLTILIVTVGWLWWNGTLTSWSDALHARAAAHSQKQR